MNFWLAVILFTVSSSGRVATNLEKPGLLREFSEPGKFMEF